ncbi:MAG TPA: TIGR01841 family phasin [Nevskiaceae bacterium]
MERLRRESLETVIAANKIVYNGVQQIADSELKLLNESYRSAVRSLKKSRDTGSRRDAVGAQIEILQETANRVIGAARETLHIVLETRKELTQLVRRHADGAAVPVAKADAAVKQARKAVKETTATARRASSKASRTRPPARKTAKAATKPAKPRKATGKRSTATTSGAATKAPNSRANAATTRAKRASAKATTPKAATPPPAVPPAAGNDDKISGPAA